MGPFASVQAVRTRGAMLRFCVLTGSTWAAYVAALMANTFMFGHGVDPFFVGIVIMAGNGLAIAVHPFISNAADTPDWLTSQRMGIILSFVQIVLMGSCLVGSSEAAVMATLALICMIARNIPALTNAVAVFYRKNGADIDYGIARGVGALADAASAALLGALVTFVGPDTIMYAGIAFHALLIMAFWMMPTPGESPEDSDPLAVEEKVERSDYAGFIKGNPGFLTVVGGFALGKLMPQMLAVYGILLFKSLGGTNADLGLAVAIAQCVQLPTMMLHSTLERRFSTERVLVFAVIGCTVRAVVTSYAASLPMLMLAYALSIAEGLCAPSEVSYAEKHFSHADTNKAQGLMAMTDPLASVFGTLLGGALVDVLGVDLFFDVLAACTVVGLVLVLAGVCAQEKTMRRQD